MPVPVRVSTLAVMVQPLLLVAKVVAPVPEPPARVRVMDVPATTTRVVLETVRVACSRAQVRVTALLVRGT